MPYLDPWPNSLIFMRECSWEDKSWKTLFGLVIFLDRCDFKYVKDLETYSLKGNYF